MKKILAGIVSIVTHPFVSVFALTCLGLGLSFSYAEGALRFIGFLGIPAGLGVWFLAKALYKKFKK